jgi:hypothetical protein
LGAAANRSAETFAGQVFPALATEQQAKNRQYYEDQIKTIQDDIDKIRATKGTLISDNLAKLRTAQLQHQMDVAKLKLSQQTADRNWAIQKRKTAQGDEKLNIDQATYNLKVAALKQAGYYKGVAADQHQQSLDQAATRMYNQNQQAMQRIGLSKDRLKEEIRYHLETNAVANGRLQLQQQKNAQAIVDAAMSPGGSKPVTLTTKIPLRQDDPAVTAAILGRGSGDVHTDANGNWYEYKKMTLTPAQWAHGVGTPNTGGVKDPNALYQLLIDNNTPAAMAKSVVRSRIGDTAWSPGQKASYTTADLAKMSIPKLENLAKARGFTSSGRQVTKQRAIDFILATNP